MRKLNCLPACVANHTCYASGARTSKLERQKVFGRSAFAFDPAQLVSYLVLWYIVVFWVLQIVNLRVWVFEFSQQFGWIHSVQFFQKHHVLRESEFLFLYLAFHWSARRVRTQSKAENFLSLVRSNNYYYATHNLFGAVLCSQHRIWPVLLLLVPVLTPKSYVAFPHY